MAKRSHSEKLKIVSHFLSSGNYTTTSRLFHCTPRDIKNYIKAYGNDDIIIKKELSIEKANVKLLDTKDAEEINSINELRKSAVIINKMAVERILKLIRSEASLDRSLKAYQITSTIIMNTAEKDPEQPKKLFGDIFQQFNQPQYINLK